MSYSFLLEMAWKSAAISGAVLALAMLLRSRSAADRGALLRVGVVTLLLLPAVSLLLPSLIVETAAPEAAPVAAGALEPAALLAASAPPATALPDGASLAAPGGMTPMAASADLTGDWNDPGILFLLLYVGGLLMVGGRLAVGIRTLARWTAEAAEVECGQWQAALARAASGRGIRLLVSDEVKSPLSWGWRRPAILLDPDTLRRPDDADAILAHEVAHIVRGDWPSLIGSRVAVALFWFNPLVWRLDREVAQQAEEAADSYAIAQVEPTRYAQTLLDWARTSGGLVPANAMAGEHGLARRVRALLDGRAGRRSGSAWTFAAMVACAAIAAPVAALEFVPQAPEAPDLPESAEAPEARPAPAAPELEAAAAPLRTVPLPPAPPVRADPVPPSAPIAPIAPVAVPAPPRPPIASLQALAFAPRVPAPIIDEKAIQAEVDAAVAEAMRTSVNVRIDAERIAADAQRAADAALAGSAHGMLAGADGMERGADRMREEARRLRDRDYRERQIAKEAARGHRVTHEDLLEAAEGMEEGAQGMREGAREMRQAAREMRRRS